MALCLSTAAWVLTSAAARPTGPQVISGSVGLASVGNSLTITEMSTRAIINWNSFSIGAGESVQIIQPLPQSSLLNRVTGNSSSVIAGSLRAGREMMLVNPNGITVAQGGNIAAASLLATSSAIADSDYLAGKYRFSPVVGQGNIVNQGSITATEGGQVVLSAPQVDNQGSIAARLGRITLGGAAGFALDTAGDGLWRYQIADAAAAALVSNSGSLSADGGTVQVSASALGKATRDVINTSGMIEAHAVEAHNGEIILDGGDQGGVTLTPSSVIDVSGLGAGSGGSIRVTGGQTAVSGSLLARGGPDGGDGGQIETSGHQLSIGTALVDAGAPKGHAGSWLLDPFDLTVDAAAAATIGIALNGGDVTLQTSDQGCSGSGLCASGNGDITIGSPITWSGDHTLSLSAWRDININANVFASGANAGLVLKYAQGDASGNELVRWGSSVTMPTTAHLSICGGVGCNPETYQLIGSVNDLSLLDGAVPQNGPVLFGGDKVNPGRYALVGDLDLSGVANRPAYGSPAYNGDTGVEFTGKFDGLGHVINKFTQITTSNSNGWQGFFIFWRQDLLLEI